MPTKARVAFVAVVLAVGLAACGSSSSSHSAPASPAASTPATGTTSSGGAAATGAPAIAADPSGQLKFSTNSLSAKAGKVTISFTNKSPVAHNLTIQQGTSGKVIGATPTFSGATKTLTVNLKPGTYTFYCSVPGHRAAGMQGTLIVK
jgi:plastocyanin